MSQSLIASDITVYVRTQQSNLNGAEQHFCNLYQDTSFTKYINDYINTKKQQRATKNIQSQQDVSMLAVEKDFLFQIVLIEDLTTPVVQQIDNLHAKLNPMNIRVDTANNSIRNNANTRRLVSSIDDNEEDGQSSAATTTGGTDNNNNNSTDTVETNVSNKVFKITLQDKQGNMFYAMTNGFYLNIIRDLMDTSTPTTLRPILGSKVIICKSTLFNRGMFHIRTNSNIKYLGYNSRITKWNENINSKMLQFWKHKLVDVQQQYAASTRKRTFEEL